MIFTTSTFTGVTDIEGGAATWSSATLLGNGETFNVGEYVEVTGFPDCTGLPDDAVINSVTVKCTASINNSSGAPSSFRIQFKRETPSVLTENFTPDLVASAGGSLSSTEGDYLFVFPNQFASKAEIEAADFGHVSLPFGSESGGDATYTVSAFELEIDYSDAAEPSIAPDHGGSVGGTAVVIIGGPFDTTELVNIGGNVVVPDSFPSANELNFIAPAHVPGVVDVSVYQPSPYALINSFTYTYEKVTVTAVVPGSGTMLGGTAVTVTGTNFSDGCTVYFDGVPATDVVVVSDTMITCVTPGHTVGFVDVTVVKP